MEIVAIVGSIRKAALNLQLVKHIQSRYTGQFFIKILDFTSSLTHN